MTDHDPDPRPDREPRDSVVPVDEKDFWHDGYEPIRRRRADETTGVQWLDRPPQEERPS